MKMNKNELKLMKGKHWMCIESGLTTCTESNEKYSLKNNLVTKIK